MGSAELSGAGELRVLTFNLRYASDDPPHPWAARRPAVAALLRRESPHLLGTQEGLPGQLRDVAADLPARYACVSRGRDADGGGEAMAVWYDTERLATRAHGHYWLSDTPDVPGSRTWGGEWPRMVTWVRFADASTGRELYAVNTHLEAFDAEARVRSAELLVERTPRDRGVPVVLTGDFNEPAGGAGAPAAGRAGPVRRQLGGCGRAWSGVRDVRRLPAAGARR